VRQDREPEDPIEVWTLLEDDMKKVGNKPGATCFEVEARFPESAEEMPAAAVAYVAQQVKVSRRSVAGRASPNSGTAPTIARGAGPGRGAGNGAPGQDGAAAESDAAGSRGSASGYARGADVHPGGRVPRWHVAPLAICLDQSSR
jgi:hypothetical protein